VELIRKDRELARANLVGGNLVAAGNE
jgi:hypothetical protein